MAKKLISFNFNREFIPELESLSKSHPIAEVNTMYFTSVHSRITDLKTDTYLAEAIANYLGTVDTLHLFVGKTTKNQYVAEYQKPGKDDIQICIGAVTGGSFVFKAGSIEEETGLLSQYEAGHKGTVFVMDMLPKILEDKEASICLSDLHAFRIEDESYSKAMCKLFNNIYYRVKDEKSTSPVPYFKEPKKIFQADIDRAEVESIFCGEPKVFSRPSDVSFDVYDEEDFDLPSSPTSEIRNMYLLDAERVLTEEEEKRVPDLGDWYVVPEWSKKTARRIASSRRFRKSIGNILLWIS
ncbi:hypothetical protein [Butyrivibrio sp. XPD2002]|uniref:hypothetical protein n=1 Tax=Butyrivibrio sp. XPD2002 TaxID=1280665 RepID=UPI00041D7CB0|nr:hypothetical protein [Butyrivibrio sp. XPD2002]